MENSLEASLSDDRKGLPELVNTLATLCHELAAAAGWWNHPASGESLIGRRNVGEMLALIHSEISEALEGWRKSAAPARLKPDEHLPEFASITVELADAIIRIGDLAVSLQRAYPAHDAALDLGRALAAKLTYNASREDHRPENRIKNEGKAF